MGFSYVVAVAVLLSSSLIFFGIIYSDYVHADAELKKAQDGFNTHSYNYLNSRVNITGYSYVASGTQYNVTVNMTNTGSATLNLNNTNLLVNGTITNFTYAAQYVFPQGNDNITFRVAAGTYVVELAFNTGYEKFMEVTV